MPSGAGAMIIERSRGRIMLLRRSAAVIHGGAWNLPGGYVEPGELRWQTAARELVEEAGISPRNTAIEWAGTKEAGPFFALVGYVAAPVPVTLNYESDGFGWFTAREIVSATPVMMSVRALLGARVQPLRE